MKLDFYRKQFTDLGAGKDPQKIKYLCNYISTDANICAILATWNADLANFDVHAWTELTVKASSFFNDIKGPATEQAYNGALYYLLKHVSSVDKGEYLILLGTMFSAQSNGVVTENINLFVREFVLTFIDSISIELTFTQSIMYTLKRYSHKVALFDKLSLYDAYSANTAKGEAIYDKHFRSWMFDNGYDIISQSTTESGKADALGDLATGVRLAGEIKLHKKEGNVPYLAKGLSQAHRYAVDHNLNAAYLLIFNITESILIVEDLDPDVPITTINGVKLYVIIVDATKRSSASTEGSMSIQKINSDKLLKEVKLL